MQPSTAWSRRLTNQKHLHNPYQQLYNTTIRKPTTPYIYAVQTFIMKFVSTVLLLTFSCFLQATEEMKRDTFKQKIDSINFYLTEYDSLPYWCPNEDCYLRMEVVQGKIIDGLLDVLSDPKIIKYDLNKCFNQNSLSHANSPDGKVHFFSIDEKTGGTYRSSLTILHTQGKNNTVRASFLSGSQESYGYSSFYTIHMLDSTKQTYLALGAVRSCSTCMSEFAITVSADTAIDTKLVLQLDFRIDSDNGITYTDSTKTLSYVYVSRTDDSLFGERSIGDDQESEAVELISYTGEYKFRNGIFVEMSKCQSRQFTNED